MSGTKCAHRTCERRAGHEGDHGGLVALARDVATKQGLRAANALAALVLRAIGEVER